MSSTVEGVHGQAVMDRFSARTETEDVALALLHLAGQRMTREEALQMRGPALSMRCRPIG